MKIDMIPIDKINPYENNPRKISDLAISAVEASIKKYGIRQPLVVAGPDNSIIVGHTRWNAMKKMGFTEVPCLRADDMTQEQIDGYRIIDNKSGEKSVWDFEKLQIEMEKLDITQDVFNLSFSPIELEAIMQADWNKALPEPDTKEKSKKDDRKIEMTEVQYSKFTLIFESMKLKEPHISEAECLDRICDHYLEQE